MPCQCMACKSWIVSRYMSNDGHCLPELGEGSKFYLGKRMNKFEYKGMGRCAIVEISPDPNNADQK